MKSAPKAMKAGAKATKPISTAKKSMAKGPKKPMPNDPKPTDPAALAMMEEGQRRLRKKGLQIGLPFFGGTIAVGIPAVARKSEEARLDAKGSRQGARASRKEGRSKRLAYKAEEIAETSPNKAARLGKRSARLKEKSTELYTRSAANKKAAEAIYNAKQKKK